MPLDPLISDSECQWNILNVVKISLSVIYVCEGRHHTRASRNSPETGRSVTFADSSSLNFGSMLTLEPG